MPNGIDMVNEGLPLGTSRDSVVQSGGGGGSIDMMGTPYPMSNTPVSSVQRSGGSGNIDMVGEQGLLSHNPTPPYGAEYPKDKGE